MDHLPHKHPLTEKEEEEEEEEEEEMISMGYGRVHESLPSRVLSSGKQRGASSRNTSRVGDSEEYRECLKNHAASMGGHAVDGCGEFMPGGPNGSMEALKCAACGCHRNFHRRSEPEEKSHHLLTATTAAAAYPNFFALPPPPIITTSTTIPIPTATLPKEQQHYLVPVMGPRGFTCEQQPRFRTKFSAEQKEKMRVYAESVGWRLQRSNDESVHQFCAEIGVKRHVLKVWMHNNKHSFTKSALPTPLPPAPASP